MNETASALVRAVLESPSPLDDSSYYVGIMAVVVCFCGGLLVAGAAFLAMFSVERPSPDKDGTMRRAVPGHVMASVVLGIAVGSPVAGYQVVKHRYWSDPAIQVRMEQAGAARNEACGRLAAGISAGLVATVEEGALRKVVPMCGWERLLEASQSGSSAMRLGRIPVRGGHEYLAMPR